MDSTSDMMDLITLTNNLYARGDVGELPDCVIEVCTRAKTWLRRAMEQDDLDEMAAIKAHAATLRSHVLTWRIGKDAELAATEIVRRAERGLGQAIRKGQAAGNIKSKQAGSWSAQQLREHNGRTKAVSNYLPRGTPTCQIYTMTDGVSDDEFDAAIAAGKAERNLSRANLVKLVRAQKSMAPTTRSQQIAELADQAYSSRQIAKQLGITDERVRELANRDRINIPADALVGRTKRIDPNRVVGESVTTLEGIAMSLDLVLDNLDGIDKDQIQDWETSLNDSLRRITQLRKRLREITE